MTSAPMVGALLATLMGSVVSLHLHEAEALAAARVTILDDLRADDGSELEEHLFQRLARHAVRKVTDIKFLTHENKNSYR